MCARAPHLTGEVCTPDGRYPSVGTQVTLTVGAQTYSTITDEDGSFDLFCVPGGEASVHLRKGHFTESVSMTIAARGTSEMPRTCLDPTTPEVAVVTGTHDSVQVLLRQAGIPYDEYDGITGRPSLLDDRDLLLSYDILMLNWWVRRTRRSASGGRR